MSHWGEGLCSPFSTGVMFSELCSPNQVMEARHTHTVSALLLVLLSRQFWLVHTRYLSMSVTSLFLSGCLEKYTTDPTKNSEEKKFSNWMKEGFVLSMKPWFWPHRTMCTVWLLMSVEFVKRQEGMLEWSWQEVRAAGLFGICEDVQKLTEVAQLGVGYILQYSRCGDVWSPTCHELLDHVRTSLDWGQQATTHRRERPAPRLRPSPQIPRRKMVVWALDLSHTLLFSSNMAGGDSRLRPPQ